MSFKEEKKIELLIIKGGLMIKEKT